MLELETVTLRAGLWQAQIVPGIGMNTLSLTCGGVPVLRSPESLETLQGDPCVYGTPILLPPNRTEGGKFRFDGQVYHLGVNEPAFGNHLHGRIHSQPFSVKYATDTTVSGCYENRGETFPFPFRLDANFYLTPEGYAQEFLVTNTGNRDMPLAFGLHTVFAAPEWIRVPIHRRWLVNDCYIPTGELEELSAEALSYREGTAPEGKLVRGFYTSRGWEARVGEYRYRVSGNFDQWVLWNGDGNSGFCAVEPMCGAVNALNSGEGLLRLKPGQTERFATTISKK